MTNRASCFRCRDDGIYFENGSRHFCDCDAADEYRAAIAEARADIAAAEAALNMTGPTVSLNNFKSTLLH